MANPLSFCILFLSKQHGSSGLLFRVTCSYVRAAQTVGYLAKQWVIQDDLTCSVLYWYLNETNEHNDFCLIWNHKDALSMRHHASRNADFYATCIRRQWFGVVEWVTGSQSRQLLINRVSISCNSDLSMVTCLAPFMIRARCLVPMINSDRGIESNWYWSLMARVRHAKISWRCYPLN